MANDDSTARKNQWAPWESIAQQQIEELEQRAREERAGEQLGLWPEDQYGCPNVMLRSALFCAGKPPTKREILQDYELPVSGPLKAMRYSGERLYQPDLDVFLECVFRCRLLPAGGEARFTTHSFLKSLGIKSMTAKSYETLRSTIERLRWTKLCVESDRYVLIDGLLRSAKIDKVFGDWRISVDPEIAALFAPKQHSWLYSSTRRALGKSYLAKWLHGYFSTNEKPRPISVKSLHELSGSSDASMRRFRQRLREALDEIVFVELVAQRRFAWRIDADDLVHVVPTLPKRDLSKS